MSANYNNDLQVNSDYESEEDLKNLEHFIKDNQQFQLKDDSSRYIVPLKHGIIEYSTDVLLTEPRCIRDMNHVKYTHNNSLNPDTSGDYIYFSDDFNRSRPTGRVAESRFPEFRYVEKEIIPRKSNLVLRRDDGSAFNLFDIIFDRPQ